MGIATLTILKILKKLVSFGIIGRLGAMGLFCKIGKKCYFLYGATVKNFE